MRVVKGESRDRAKKRKGDRTTSVVALQGGAVTLAHQTIGRSGTTEKKEERRGGESSFAIARGKAALPLSSKGKQVRFGDLKGGEAW